MTTYSTKAAAKKGAKRQNLDLDTLNFLENAEGRWYWEESKAEEVVETAQQVEEPVVNALHMQQIGRANRTPGPVEVTDIVPGVGIKIEKDRPEQNGIVRPSVGGKCRAIWDACDTLYATKGRVPMPKEMKDLAKGWGWNENNAVIEMYQWRKFNGYTGRQK